MLPTSPREFERSMSSSCTTPAIRMATRVSCDVLLTRTSSIEARVLRHFHAGRVQELRRLEQRQPHHARIAALEALDEDRRQSLDRVSAGLVVGFARHAVALDVLCAERLE